MQPHHVLRDFSGEGILFLSAINFCEYVVEREGFMEVIGIPLDIGTCVTLIRNFSFRYNFKCMEKLQE